LPLHNFRLLLMKEWRELLVSRSFWLLLLLIGPLVGHAFIVAVNLYAEASGSGGTPAALPQGLTPLDGILVPTWGVYDLAATFFLPFVAIRLISSEKQSGALKLLLQLPNGLAAKLAAKFTALMLGWFVSCAAGLIAIALWKFYGGHLYFAETLNLFVGHFLRAMLSISIAVAAAALSESAASAAIVTLAITIGSWALDFIAAGRGGLLQQLANYTPTAALRSFEQGLFSINTTLVMIAIIVAGFAVAAIWLHPGRTWRRATVASAVLLVALATVIPASTLARASWDSSENRRNSFAPADEAALHQIRQPLRITINLAPEDPRLTDFEQNVLRKLRRNLPNLQVDYSADSQTGLFGNSDQYGEIWYEMNGQKIVDRSTIDEVVLENIYKLAGRTAPVVDEEQDFPGYPLATRPRWAAGVFYVFWPIFITMAWIVLRRRETRK